MTPPPSPRWMCKKMPRGGASVELEVRLEELESACFDSAHIPPGEAQSLADFFQGPWLPSIQPEPKE